jgi:hypothetical protein
MATLWFDIRARTQKFTQGMQTVDKRLGGLKRQTREVSGHMRAMFGVAAGVGFGAMIKNSLDGQAALFDLSKRLGISTEALSQLQYAAEQSGVSANTFNMGLQRMIRRVSEAASGTGEAVKALDELGLSAVALEQMAPEQQFAKLSDAIMKVENPADQVRLAMKLFDSEGVALIQTMQGGSTALAGFAEEANKLGKTVGGDAAAQAKAATDAFARMGAAGTGLSNTLAIQLAPSLETAANWLANGIPKAGVHLQRGFLMISSAAISLMDKFLAARSVFNMLTMDFEEMSALEKLRVELQASQKLIDDQANALAIGTVNLQEYGEAADTARFQVENMNAALKDGESNTDNAPVTTPITDTSGIAELEQGMNEIWASIFKKREDVKKQHDEIVKTSELDLMNTLVNIQAGGNKKVAKLNKAARLSQAIVDGWAAVQAALAAPPGPPWNFPIVAATTAMQLSNVAAIKGAAHGGLTNVPAESTYLLAQGERVLSPAQNRDFTSFIAQTGGEPSVSNYTLNLSAIDLQTGADFIMNNSAALFSAINQERFDRGASAL